MPGPKIKFGTDGWRGVIGYDYTVQKVMILAKGLADYAKGLKKDPKVIIGYDTRFLSDRFAKLVSFILSDNGISSELSDSFIPTPVVSSEIVSERADLGVMITASHNPYYYNGFKVKGSYGGSATMDIVTDIESEVNKNLDYESGQDYLYADAAAKDRITLKDFKPGYIKRLSDITDSGLISSYGHHILIEPMFGACQGMYKDVIEKLAPRSLFEIHGEINTSFGGINPEPIGDNLAEAAEKIKGSEAKIAICLDGDGDRIAALGEDGNFISSHHIFAVLLYDLINRGDIQGKVVKTVSVSSVIDRMCKANGIDLVTKPIGFKYIGEEILKGGIIAGGEESGGLWVKGNIPERDGMFIGLKLLEIIARNKKDINQILEDIYNKYGYFSYLRNDHHISDAQKEKLRSALSLKVPELIKAQGAVKVVTIDGFKYFFEDGSWLMIRPSGTEAVIRVYTEAETSDKSASLQKLGREVIQKV